MRCAQILLTGEKSCVRAAPVSSTLLFMLRGSPSTSTVSSFVREAQSIFDLVSTKADVDLSLFWSLGLHLVANYPAPVYRSIKR